MTKKPSQPMPVPAIPKLSEGQLEPLFRRLNLAHTRRIYQEVADRAEQENWTYRDFLALLLAEEVAHRKQTRLQRCTRQAHFPFFKTIDEFDFTLQSTLRQSLLGSYLGPDFVTEGRSLILYGKAGRGKTHLAVAIGYRAIQNGFETLCITAAKLIEDLSNASAKGLLHQSLAAYTRPHVLVIDEIGYLSYGPDAANVLFHVVNDRHLRKRPMIFTTNKPLSVWGKVLHDEDLAAAILDRVLERGRFVPLDGPSGRTRHLNLEEVSPSKADRLRISGINGSEFPEPTTIFVMPLSIRASSALDGLRIFEEDQRETPGSSVQIDLDPVIFSNAEVINAPVGTDQRLKHPMGYRAQINTTLSNPSISAHAPSIRGAPPSDGRQSQVALPFAADDSA
jgi:DNA replication protein DnaC